MRKRIKIFLLSYKIFILVACLLGIFIDIFLFNFAYDLITLFLIGLWILTIWLYKFEGRVSIAGGLVFLIFCPFLLIINKKPIAEKLAIWAYMFLLVGVIQLFIEYVGENREKRQNATEKLEN